MSDQPLSRVVEALAAIAVPLAVVCGVAVVTGYARPEVTVAQIWSVTPVGLLSGGWSELAGASTPCAASTMSLALRVDYALIFLATCLVEAPFYWWATRGLSLARRLAVLMWLNVATHPLIFFALPCVIDDYRTFAMIAESYAAFGEAALLAHLLTRLGGTRGPHAAAGALVLGNLASWTFAGFVYFI